MIKPLIFNEPNRIQGSHFSGDTTFHVFSRLFLGKSNEIPGQFDFESVWEPWEYALSLTYLLEDKIQDNDTRSFYGTVELTFCRKIIEFEV